MKNKKRKFRQEFIEDFLEPEELGSLYSSSKDDLVDDFYDDELPFDELCLGELYDDID